MELAGPGIDIAGNTRGSLQPNCGIEVFIEGRSQCQAVIHHTFAPCPFDFLGAIAESQMQHAGQKS